MIRATTVCILLLLAAIPAREATAGVEPVATGAYRVEFAVVLPGTPEAIYDAITGDISGWWDHSFSPKPRRLYLEPKPGGGFYEIFNDRGDGALHATVIYAERGKQLRFEGPLGLSGRAVQNVVTYTLSPEGADSTRLGLSVHISGEIDQATAVTVEKVWRHFLVERFAPYVQAGGHRNRPAGSVH